MIVRPGGWGFRVVRQADHARLAGRMLALFRLPELLEHPLRDALLRAVAEHDNGWWEEDAAPRLDAASGGPVDFRAIPEPVRREIWRRGVERYAADEPYVAALIAGHYLRILRRFGRAPDASEEADALAARRDELFAAAAVEHDAGLDDDRWLALGDALALAAATADEAFLRLPGWQGRVVETAGALELRLDPFPLAGTTRFELEQRTLAGGASDAVALGLALATAPTRRLTIRLRPLTD
jgi:hypothetical protein